MSRSFTELTVDANVAAWIPTEDYASLILEGVVCYGQLSANGITAIEYDMGAGKGDTVNIRTVTARTHECSVSSCGCLSVTSNTLGEATIDVNAYGDYDKICGFTEWKTNGNILQVVAKEMSKRMANCRDSAIWTLLCNCTPNLTGRTKSVWSWKESIASVTCCEYQFDLYNSIVSVRQHLIGDCYNPDVVLLHPYAAAYLYYKENSAMPDFGSTIRYSADGSRVETLLGMRVIEVGVAAADDSSPATANDEVAFVIDSSRAIGEVFGKRPTMNTFYDGKCDATELTMWQYWGAAILDGNAVGVITS